jgi:hypothetical protein
MGCQIKSPPDGFRAKYTIGRRTRFPSVSGAMRNLHRFILLVLGRSTIVRESFCFSFFPEHLHPFTASSVLRASSSLLLDSWSSRKEPTPLDSLCAANPPFFVLAGSVNWGWRYVYFAPGVQSNFLGPFARTLISEDSRGHHPLRGWLDSFFSLVRILISVPFGRALISGDHRAKFRVGLQS